MNVTLKSYMVLFVAKNRQFLQMLSPDTRAMGRIVDLVRYYFSVTKARVQRIRILLACGYNIMSPRGKGKREKSITGD